jgi:hypothetical protein
LWTTPSDLAKSSSSLSLGTACFRPVGCDHGDPCHAGIRIGCRGGDQRWFEHRDNVGFQAFFVGSVTGVKAVVMTNPENGGVLAHEVVRAIAREYGWRGYPLGEVRDAITIAPERLARYEGTFASTELTLRIERKVTGYRHSKLGIPAIA